MIAIATQCFGPDFGGIETLMTSLADELTRGGQGVEVFADRIRRLGAAELIRPYTIQRFGFWRPVRRIMKRRSLGTAAAQNPFTGVFTDSWKSVAAIPEGIGPIAVLAHGNELPRDAASPRGRRVRHALSRARTVVASSRFTADLAQSLTPGSTTQIVVINPPLPPQEKARAPALEKLRAVIGGRSPIISTLCRLEPRKGVDMVLAVLPRLRQHFPDIVYLVAGAGDDLPRLRKIAGERRVEDCVVFLGPLADDQEKAAFFEFSDVFAMPVRRVAESVEGFGIVYAEAAWRGVPSVAGVEGGAADAVREGETGLLCRGDDEGEVFAALFKLLGDEGLRRRLGSAARHHALTNLSWTSALPRYLAAIGL